MRKPVATARPNSSIVFVVDSMTGKPKYHVHNRSTVIYENRITGEYKSAMINRFVRSKTMEVNVWELAKRRYRRAIRVFRDQINSILLHVYTDIPDYRDCDVSDIIALIKSLTGVNIEDVALTIFNFIQTKNNGKGCCETGA